MLYFKKEQYKKDIQSWATQQGFKISDIDPKIFEVTGNYQSRDIKLRFEFVPWYKVRSHTQMAWIRGSVTCLVMIYIDNNLIYPPEVFINYTLKTTLMSGGLMRLYPYTLDPLSILKILNQYIEKGSYYPISPKLNTALILLVAFLFIIAVFLMISS
ncbi:MAG: hypothetical protein KBB55_03075 [Candidatus Buchananbacteria bacterium]|nr:hypothetical protein [Candidatus Buchananbacteria bacterium]